jgi:O-antigen/teichoic acid export membrane protein
MSEATEIDIAAPEEPPTQGGGRTVANAIWNAMGTVSAIAIGIVTAPILIRNLGASDYGLFVLIASITGMLGVMSFGLGEATLRYVAYYHGDQDLEGVNRVLGSTLTFYVSVAALVTAVLGFGAPWIVRLLNVPADQYSLMIQLLWLTAVIFSLGIVIGALAVIPSALQRYDISTKVTASVNIVRTAGFIALVLTGFGLLGLVIWDLAVTVVLLGVWVRIARGLMPGIRVLPSFSFAGLKEVWGYSVFSFLTYVFHSMYRESSKVIVSAFAGTAAVSYLGPADNTSHRLYSVVMSGIETLVPRFSATRDQKSVETLLINATWLTVTVSVMILVPLAALMPQLLAIWINPDFAAKGAVVGQCISLSFLGSSGFAPAASYLRGSGRPGVVTISTAGAGLVVAGASFLLVPKYGVAGVGYANLLATIAWLIGTYFGWKEVLETGAFRTMMRVAILPLTLGALAFYLQTVIGQSVRASWAELFAFGAAYSLFCGAILLGADLLLGGRSPARELFARLGTSRKFNGMLRMLNPKPAR